MPLATKTFSCLCASMSRYPRMTIPISWRTCMKGAIVLLKMLFGTVLQFLFICTLALRCGWVGVCGTVPFDAVAWEFDSLSSLLSTATPRHLLSSPSPLLVLSLQSSTQLCPFPFLIKTTFHYYPLFATLLAKQYRHV